MNKFQFLSLQVGPYSDVVKNAFQALLTTRLLQFRGELGSYYKRVEELGQAICLAQEQHEDGRNWITLREHEDAYAVGGGSFLEQQPWKTSTASIRSFYGLLATYIDENLPQQFNRLYDDVFADLRSCFRCLIFRGSFDEFHTALWEAYCQGGWPCGWSGDVVERENGSYDISRAVICVYWRPSVTQ
jgi:hypothetical protein